MKIKLALTLYFDFCFVTKLILSRNIEIRHKSFIKLPNNTIILARRDVLRSFWNLFSL